MKKTLVALVTAAALPLVAAVPLGHADTPGDRPQAGPQAARQQCTMTVKDATIPKDRRPVFRVICKRRITRATLTASVDNFQSTKSIDPPKRAVTLGGSTGRPGVQHIDYTARLDLRGSKANPKSNMVRVTYY